VGPARTAATRSGRVQLHGVTDGAAASGSARCEAREGKFDDMGGARIGCRHASRRPAQFAALIEAEAKRRSKHVRENDIRVE